MCGEFAYQARFDRREDVHQVIKQRVEELFIKLQQVADGWLLPRNDEDRPRLPI